MLTIRTLLALWVLRPMQVVAAELVAPATGAGAAIGTSFGIARLAGRTIPLWAVITSGAIGAITGIGFRILAVTPKADAVRSTNLQARAHRRWASKGAAAQQAFVDSAAEREIVLEPVLEAAINKGIAKDSAAAKASAAKPKVVAAEA